MQQDVTSAPPAAAPNSLAREWIHAARYYLGNRRILIVAAVAAGAGLALNWSWLAAAGILPILLSLLPCAVMCVLGLCVSRHCAHSDAAERSASGTDASSLHLRSESTASFPSCCQGHADAAPTGSQQPAAPDQGSKS